MPATNTEINQKPGPDENVASLVTAAMTGSKVFETKRLATGNQNHVYAVRTDAGEYVIRLTSAAHKDKFTAALYWQQKLLPLGVPLAHFIAADLEGRFSSFPALLMNRLPGDDLGAVYTTLSDSQKQNLAQQMTTIHAGFKKLPNGQKYGYASSYETPPLHKSWYDFLLKDMNVAAARIRNAASFDESFITSAFYQAENLKSNLLEVRPDIFMPDTTVKNVIVYNGRLSGIVDVDEMCFGDPLFVLALTYAGSEIDGHDTIYADCWADALGLDNTGRQRLEFYRLVHTLSFMGEHMRTGANGQKSSFDAEKLKTMCRTSSARLEKIAKAPPK